MFRTRFHARLLHHFALGASSIALAVLFMEFFPKRDFISRLSVGTAYPALFLTATALLLGPLNVLLHKSNPLSFDLRRDTGIWAGIMALIHTTIGLNVHLRGRMWLYFVQEDHSIRRDAFGFANYTGAAAVLIFALLLSLSNDWSLRRFGAKRWKSLQRWTYAAAALTAAHAVAYEHVEDRVFPLRLVLYGVLGSILVLQIAGVFKRLLRRE
ncbi:MAG: ferric reductase-like transmembrane domain-containing protein [Candidatus Acidiferrales bacterium]